MRLIAALLLCASMTASAHADDPAHIVVVELYQSQGCSSCPPADAVLNGIADRPDVIALNFAVTYWDYLGWKDSFAQPAFNRRQADYATAGGRSNVSTPQMILDGRRAIVGSSRAETERAIAFASRSPAGPQLNLTRDSVSISAAKAERAATLWLVRYDPRNIPVPIRAGENGGRTIDHRNIVRQLIALGTWRGNLARFALPKGEPGLSRAILLQSGRGGPIIAARKVPPAG